MVNYFNAIKYPVSNIKSFIIGAILNLISLSLIPFFFVNGYIVKVIREINKKSDLMPEWNNWKEMLFDGFFVSAIIVAYLLPSLILYTIATFTTTQSLTAAVASNTVLDIGTGALSAMLISSAILFFALFLLPLAIVKFALTKEFKSAFDIKSMAIAIFADPLHYVLNLSIGAFIFVLFLLTSTLLSFVVSALLFYPTVFFYRIMAEWYTDLP